MHTFYFYYIFSYYPHFYPENIFLCQGKNTILQESPEYLIIFLLLYFLKCFKWHSISQLSCDKKVTQTISGLQNKGLFLTHVYCGFQGSGDSPPNSRLQLSCGPSPCTCGQSLFGTCCLHVREKEQKNRQKEAHNASYSLWSEVGCLHSHSTGPAKSHG